MSAPFTKTYVQEAAPADGVAPGDLWLQPSTRKLSICISNDGTGINFMAVIQGAVPNVTIADIAGTVPAGGTGAAAGAWDTAAHRDTAITTIGEIITKVNAALDTLRLKGLIS